MTNAEKIQKLEEFIKEESIPNFDFNNTQLKNGNPLDAFKYGVISGKQDLLILIKLLADTPDWDLKKYSPTNYISMDIN